MSKQSNNEEINRRSRMSKQQSTDHSTSLSSSSLKSEEEEKLSETYFEENLKVKLINVSKKSSSSNSEEKVYKLKSLNKKSISLEKPNTKTNSKSNSFDKDKKSISLGNSQDKSRRSSSVYLNDNESINVNKHGSRNKISRNSQIFLVGDDNLTMQIDGGKRRLSSFFSTSSNEETVITLEEGLTEEEVVENIKTHRQIIANTKTQQWPMHRKLKILRKAKHYLKKHEGDMKQSSQAKDILATYRTYLEKVLKRLKREIDNLVVILTPWEMRIKKIESQFGSVVASYFTFLRWIFWINTFIGLSYVVFVMVPEVILFEHKNYNSSRGLRKIKEEVDKPFLTTISDINEFEGFLKFSPIFYGYYDTDDEAPNLDFYYPLPLLYFVLTLLLFCFSFFFILRKMAKNAKLQRVGTKEEEFTFCWKLYTGWDYMIGNSETAHNKVASIVMGLKEVILEEKEKKKEARNWKLIVKKILANILTLIILCSSAYAVVLVVERSQTIDAANFFQRNEVNFVFAGLQFVCPHLFTMVAMLEDNHPRIALRWQLGRILILNILNFVCLLLSTFEKVHSQTKQLKEIKDNLTILYTMEIEENKTLDISNFITQAYLISSVTLKAVVRSKRQEGEGRLFPPSYFQENNLSFFNKTKAKNFMYLEEQLEGRQFKSKFIDNTNFYHNITDSIFSKNVTTNSIHTTTEESQDTTVATSNDLIENFTETTTEKINENLSSLTSTIKTSTVDIKTTVAPKSENLTKEIIEKEKIFSHNTANEKTVKTLKKSNVTKVSNDTNLINSQANINCTQDQNLTINPFKLFEFAQKLEREGFQNYTSTLKGLCWETSFGQELVKLTLTDLYITIITTIFADYLRAVIIRYCNGWPCFCFDLEMTFPGYADFQIAENILSLTNSQGMIWLGMFFAPGLPIINSIKLYIMMYFKSWAVLTSNIPHETVFKASGNNNFYYFLLLLMLFLACLPVAYCLVWFEPSWHCGPYSNYHNIYHILTKKVEQKLPGNVNRIIDYICSPAFIIPLLMFLVLMIYYMSTSLNSSKDANNELKSILRKDKDNSEHSKIDSRNTNHRLDEKKQVRIEEPLINETQPKKFLKELENSLEKNSKEE